MDLIENQRGSGPLIVGVDGSERSVDALALAEWEEHPTSRRGGSKVAGAGTPVAQTS
jgi:hypothetical protein